MARIRTIRPEFFMDEKLSEVSRDVRLLFAGLFQHCDVAGRGEMTPKMLKATVFPYDEDLTVATVGEWLQDLENKEFIVRYQIGGKHYVWVRNFRKHQRFSGSEATTPSLIPPCPAEQPGSERETNTETADVTAGNSGTTGEDTTKQSGSTQEPPKNPGKERKGKEEPPTPKGGVWDHLGQEFDTEEIRSAWTAFEDHRRSLGKANGGRYSPQGIENFAGSVRNAKATPKQLAGFVRFCMASGWNGLPVSALPRYLVENPDTGLTVVEGGRAQTPEEIEEETRIRRERLAR